MNRPALDRRHVRRSFGRAADRYDEAAVLHRRVADELLDRLSIIRCRPRTLLDAGCGTGYAIGALAQHYRCPVIALDLAPAMLNRARRRPGSPQLVAGDAQALPFAGGSIDLLFSNLVLQWCDPQIAFAEFRRVLSPGGLLMFSTFGPDTLKELRAAWRDVDTGVHVHRFMDMHDLGDLLLHCGFETPVVDMEHHTLTYAGLPDRKSTRLNSSHTDISRMPSSA